MSIRPPSWGVSLETVSAEQSIGRVLSTAVGWGPSAFINWATTEIPKYVEGIDKEADPFLEQLIAALESLAEGWKHAAEPDAQMLSKTMAMLSHLSTHTDRSNLLYPQIMQEKPRSTSTTIQGEEAKEIEEKQNLARHKAQEINLQLVEPLISSLKHFLTPTISSHRDPKRSLENIGELCAALKEIAHEQRSVVSKVLHTITAIVKKTFKEQWEGSQGHKGKSFTINSHPLLQLLSMIGHYSLEKTYLKSDKERKIDQALRLLDTQCEPFRGIYQNLHGKSGSLKELHKSVTDFVKQVVGRLQEEEKKEVYIQVANFALSQREELARQQLLKLKEKQDNAEQKAQTKLKDEYKKIDDRWGFTGNKDQQKQEALTNVERELQREKTQIEESFDAEISKIKKSQFWDAIDRDRQSWGRSFCEKGFKPNQYLDENAQNEILWKALAFQQQKSEWMALGRKLDSQAEKKPDQIISSFELAIDYLERFVSIEEGLDEEAKKQSLIVIHTYVLGWMDYTKVQMTANEKNTWERTKIDGAFDEALQGIRKGEIVQSVQSIQNFIRESNYWKEIWKGVSSPLEFLSEPFKGFCSTMPPPKPPKSADAVRGLLADEAQGPWNPAWLQMANQKEKEQVLENALAFGCFEFVARVLKLMNGDKISTYKRLVQALDEMKKAQNSDDETLTPILVKFLNREFDAVMDKKGLDSLRSCLLIWKEKPQQLLHKHLYLELVNILIRERGGHSPRSWAVWSLYSTLYDLMELFIRPFTERLFAQVDGLFKTDAGTLGEKHLIPIVGITKAFSTYMRALDSWEAELGKQTKAIPGKTLSGTKDDLRVLLDRPERYEGMTPAQITSKIGYALIDQIQLPDYARKVANVIDKIKGIALASRAQNKYANIPIIGVQLLLASPFYLGLNVLYYVVKIMTASINIGVQQAGKWYLWKTNIIGQMLDEALESVFIDTESAPILDTLLLEQLQELLAELEKGAPPDNPQTAAGDERNKKVISEALQHLFEVIWMDKYESLQSFRSRSEMNQAKKMAYGQLKKLLTTVLVNTSKSLLQKEQVDALLFELFSIANEGLRGGKTVVLTQPQKMALENRLGHVPSEEEIQQEGARIVRENVEKIPKVLAQIRQRAINPAVDKAIDDGVQTESQLLLDYISWLQSRLFLPSEEARQSNILQFLETRLNAQDDRSEIIREIHMVYAQFVQEMTDFQTKLDSKASPNSPELNQFILIKLNEPLLDLTDALTTYIKNPETGIETCTEALNALKQVQIEGHAILNKIEEAEKSRVMGQHTGFEGFVRKKFGESFNPLKDQTKNIAHAGVQYETDNKIDELRAMYKNKILVKHMALWQMRLYLNPELAKV